ncbi:MAG TPA: hypothetical protein VI168_08750 [Croceibacterium sp.]
MAAPYEDASVEQLACASAGDDKRAALELGRRYEEGRGVPRDVRRARRYYRQAAASRPGEFYIYSPAVAEERYGRVIRVDNPMGAAPGLPEARERLERLLATEEGNAERADAP